MKLFKRVLSILGGVVLAVAAIVFDAMIAIVSTIIAFAILDIVKVMIVSDHKVKQCPKCKPTEQQKAGQ